MTEKLNRQFAVSTICDAVENAPPIYKLDVVHPEPTAKSHHMCDLLLPKLVSGEVDVSKSEIETGAIKQ